MGMSTFLANENLDHLFGNGAYSPPTLYVGLYSSAPTGAGGDDIFDFTGEADGTYNQLTRFDDITIDCGISDTLQIQMTRTDSETGDVSAVFIDLHGEVDSDGSDTEISKS